MKYEIFECLRQINQIDYEVPVFRSSRKLDFGIVETEEEEGRRLMIEFKRSAKGNVHTILCFLNCARCL
jgi:hypothetical protein